jgi:hypothetical protein
MYLRIFWLFSLLLVTPIILSAKSTTETPPGLQAAYQQVRHQIEVIEEKGQPTRWHAVNANNHLSVDFNGKGIKARSTKDDWNLMMELNKIGALENLQSVNKPNVTVKDNRLTYDRGNIQEWYINDPRGLEQGFTLNKPLAKKRLVLQFALGGDVKPRLDDQGKGLQLITPKGKKLRYEGLKAWDAKGKDLKAMMSLKDHSLQLEVAVTDAAYPITIDPWLVEEDKLTASDSTEGASFGSFVAISGDTAVVGAPASRILDGAAYIFTRDGTGIWSQQAKLAASDPAVNDRFGFSVGISGNTAVVGTITRLVYVFTRSGAAWSQQAKLTSPDTSSVAISGDTVVLGAAQSEFDGDNYGPGLAYVYTRDGKGIWSQQAKLIASDGVVNDGFGSSVAISGNTAVVGASHDDGESGSAYVFTRSGISWSQQTRLTASRRGRGLFGDSIAISGNTVVVGAFAEAHEELHFSKGSAYVFTRDDRAIWSQQARLTASDAERDDEFGTSVAISADIVVVGAPRVNDWGQHSGSAYVFTRNGITWSEQAKFTASDVVKYDSFGYSVAISGNTAMAGKAGNAGLGGRDEGSVYVFNLSNLSCEATY